MNLSKTTFLTISIMITLNSCVTKKQYLRDINYFKTLLDTLDQKIDTLKNTTNDIRYKIENLSLKMDSFLKDQYQNEKFSKEKIDKYSTKRHPKLQELEEKMETTYETESFRIRRNLNDEYIEFNKGKYYFIDINNIKTQKVLKFKPGEYVIDSVYEGYHKPILDFYDLVVSEIVRYGEDYQIFIKGSADKSADKTFERKFDPRFKPLGGKIKYYIKIYNQKSKFKPEFEETIITEPIRNEDLPNLRATFLQAVLRDNFNYIKEAILLDGGVSDRVHEEDISATLILFWPEKK